MKYMMMEGGTLCHDIKKMKKRGRKQWVGVGRWRRGDSTQRTKRGGGGRGGGRGGRGGKRKITRKKMQYVI